MKDTGGKRQLKRMLSFVFVEKRELYAMKLSFEEFNLAFFTADQSAWTNRGSKLKKLEVHSVYSMVKESTFLKGNFCIYKVFMDVFFNFTSAWKKTTKCAECAFEMYICHVLAWTDPRELLFRINLWVFESVAIQKNCKLTFRDHFM